MQAWEIDNSVVIFDDVEISDLIFIVFDSKTLLLNSCCAFKARLLLFAYTFIVLGETNGVSKTKIHIKINKYHLYCKFLHFIYAQLI